MDEEGVGPEQRQRLLNAAPSVEQDSALIGDENLRRLALPVQDVSFELIGEIVDVDHRRLDAGLHEPVEHMIDQWPAGKRYERLWHTQGQRAHALAESGSKHHRGLCLDHGRAPLQHKWREIACRRQLARVEAAKLGKRRMSEVALKIARDPRDVGEITALAVTFR